MNIKVRVHIYGSRLHKKRKEKEKKIKSEHKYVHLEKKKD